MFGYHGDSRSSLDRLEAEGSPATVDVADLLRQGYEVSKLLVSSVQSNERHPSLFIGQSLYLVRVVRLLRH